MADIPAWPEYTTELSDHALLVAETVTDAGHVRAYLPVSHALVPAGEAYVREAREALEQVIEQVIAKNAPPSTG